MGSRKKSAPQTSFTTPDTSAQQKQYQDSLSAMQQQSQASLAEVQKANQQSQAILTQQLEEQRKANQESQVKLQEYLNQLQQSQAAQQKAQAERDAQVLGSQDLEKANATALDKQNSLLAAGQVATSQFKSTTSRRRKGFLG